jgi:pimeloyl-ACP methyl ester carboxylesterase
MSKEVHMSAYVDLPGVRMWYDKQGAGDPLVMLHPGGVDSRAFGPNVDALTPHFTVYLPEQRGHGHTPDVDGPITYDLMAEDTIHFLEHVVGGPVRLMGMSDGGVVALLVTKKRPDLVKRLVFVASVFHHTGWAEGVIAVGSEPSDFMAEGYGEVSPDGRSHYATVVKKLDAMHTSGPTLTREDLQVIRCRTLVMLGDDDEVTLEHAIELYRALPDGELAVIPGTSHGLLVEKPDLCNMVMLAFLTRDPVPTLAPRRRA